MNIWLYLYIFSSTFIREFSSENAKTPIISIGEYTYISHLIDKTGNTNF
jgi:hypothetical protein